MAEIKFTPEDYQKLEKHYELPPAVISQIEKAMIGKGGWVEYFRNIPTAKQKRVAIEQLRNSVLKLTKQLKTINPFTNEYILFELSRFGGYRKEEVLKELELLGTSLAKVPPLKDDVKKKKTHYTVEDVVVAVARIMIKNNIIPVKRNKQFEGIIGIVFKTINIKASPQVVIDKCWHDIRAYMTFGDEMDEDDFTPSQV